MGRRACVCVGRVDFWAPSASSAEWFDDQDDAGGEVLRDGKRVSLGADEYEQAVEDVSCEYMSTGGAERALVHRKEQGFLAFERGLLVNEDGPLLLLEAPYQSPAFSPTGTQLALVSDTTLDILNTQDFTLESYDLVTLLDSTDGGLNAGHLRGRETCFSF